MPPPIQLPPAQQPDDYFNRLQKKFDRSDTPSKLTNSEQQTVGDIKKTVSEEEKLYTAFDQKIQKIYKTVVLPENQKTVESIMVTDLQNKGIKNKLQKIITNLTGINAALEKRRDAMKKALDKKLDGWRNKINTLYNNPKSKKVQTVYDKLVDKTTKAYNWVADKTSKTIHNVSMFLQEGVKVATSVIDCFVKVILAPFKAGWKILDNILTKVGGAFWESIKSILSIPIDAIKWIGSMALDAVSFVWKGISTVFKVGFKAISATTKYLALGVKGFFGWWFKMLVNTIFSPSMWLINIPLFIAITTVFSSAIISLIGISMPLMEDIFKGVTHGLEAFGGWIWSGISTFFEWVKKEYKGSWFESVVNEAYDSISTVVQKWFGDNKYIQKALTWINKTYEWVKKYTGPVINWVEDAFEKVSNFFQDTPRTSLLERFMEFLGKINGVAGIFVQPGLDFLRSKFGFTTTGGINNQIENQIQMEKKLGMEATLENAIASFQKGLSPTEFNNKIDAKISELQQTTFGGLSDYFLKAVRNKLSYDFYTQGKFKNVSEDSILRRSGYIIALEAQRKANDSALLNKTDPRNIERINHLIGYEKFLKDKESKILFSQDQLDDMVEALKKQEKNKNLIRTIGTKQEIEERSDISNGEEAYLKGAKYTATTLNKLFNAIGVQFRDVWSDNANGSEMDTYDKPVNELDFGAGRGDQDISALQAENAAQTQRQAHGGIVAPKSSRVIPLDAIGQQYIRDQVKNIKLPDDKINNLNDDIKNITIIEEQVSHKDSYELYTMKLLSKGLWGF